MRKFLRTWATHLTLKGSGPGPKNRSAAEDLRVKVLGNESSARKKRKTSPVLPCGCECLGSPKAGELRVGVCVFFFFFFFFFTSPCYGVLKPGVEKSGLSCSGRGSGFANGCNPQVPKMGHGRVWTTLGRCQTKQAERQSHEFRESRSPKSRLVRAGHHWGI